MTTTPRNEPDAFESTGQYGDGSLEFCDGSLPYRRSISPWELDINLNYCHDFGERVQRAYYSSMLRDGWRVQHYGPIANESHRGFTPSPIRQKWIQEQAENDERLNQATPGYSPYKCRWSQLPTLEGTPNEGKAPSPVVHNNFPVSPPITPASATADKNNTASDCRKRETRQQRTSSRSKNSTVDAHRRRRCRQGVVAERKASRGHRPYFRSNSRQIVTRASLKLAKALGNKKIFLTDGL